MYKAFGLSPMGLGQSSSMILENKNWNPTGLDCRTQVLNHWKMHNNTLTGSQFKHVYITKILFYDNVTYWQTQRQQN